MPGEPQSSLSRWGVDSSTLRLLALGFLLALAACVAGVAVQRGSLGLAPLAPLQPASTAAEACGQCAALLNASPWLTAQQPEASGEPTAAAQAEQQRQQRPEGAGLWRPPVRQGERCSALDGLLANRTTVWALQADGDSPAADSPDAVPQYRLRLDDCPLLRFEGQGARACLKGKTLVFIGDSVTRYEYMSLIYFLETLQPLPRSGNQERPSPVQEGDYGGWANYFNRTTADLNGHQLCDCFREPDHPTVENRFYERDGVRVYFFWYTTHPDLVRGHWGFPPFTNATACAPPSCPEQADWELPLPEALRQVVAPLQPSHLFLGSGLWRILGSPPWPPEAFEDAFAAAADAAVGRDFDGPAYSIARKHGLKFLDSWALTKALPWLRLAPHGNPPYWDNLHFLPPIYFELNQFMLNLVCTAPSGGDSAQAAGGDGGDT